MPAKGFFLLFPSSVVRIFIYKKLLGILTVHKHLSYFVQESGNVIKRVEKVCLCDEKQSYKKKMDGYGSGRSIHVC